MAWRGSDAFDEELRWAARLLPRRILGPRNLPLRRRLMALRSRAERGGEIEQVGEIRVQVHRPQAAGDRLPALLWIHGGGMIAGTAAEDAWLCRRFAKEHGMIVAAVDYHLAPEHAFPTALHDCHAALEWLPRLRGVDPGRIVIGGASAGGGLAAALALLARQRGGVKPIFQLLVYPMLDDRTAVDPAANDLPVRIWDNVANRFGWACYLGEQPGGAGVSALAAPGRATDLSGLPPAWIGVGTRDLFHDECLSYADRLRASGVPCELHVSPGAFHGSDIIVAKAGVSRRFVESRRQALARALDAASTS